MFRIIAFLCATFCAFAPTIRAADKVEGIAQIRTEFTQNDIETLMTEADATSLENLHNNNFDFNAKDMVGNTPLYYLMVKNDKPELVGQIISYGADVNATVGNGMIPLNITTSKANELQLQILMMKTMGIDISTPEMQEALKNTLFQEMNRMVELARILIENGADVNRESILGSPLTNAVTNIWNQDIVALLLKAGANVNWQDKEGRTALFYAAAGGNDDIITMLLKAGADPEIKDNAGKIYLDVEKVRVEPAI